MKKPTFLLRRAMLKMGLGAVASMFAARALSAQSGATPAQTQGPFYPIREQADKDADLTQIAGHDTAAQGPIIEIVGRVLDDKGAPIIDALVEIWQANAAGRYRHERDSSAVPLDPNFQGWGQTLTDAQGGYRFKTIEPGSYPATTDWVRPPHIHFKIAKRGFHELTTQMYFPGRALNQTDRILQALAAVEQEKLVALRRNVAEGAVEYLFNIVLRVVR